MPARIRKLENLIENMVAAIGQGLMPPALRQRLQEAESELQRLRSAPKPASVEGLPPKRAENPFGAKVLPMSPE